MVNYIPPTGNVLKDVTNDPYMFMDTFTSECTTACNQHTCTVESNITSGKKFNH